MTHGSQLLAARPRRSRTAGATKTVDKTITKIREKAAKKTTRPKLVRGRPRSNTPDDTSSANTAAQEATLDEPVTAGDMIAALGTGTRSKRSSGRGSDSNSSSEDDDDDDDDTSDAGSDEGDGSDSSKSSDGENFVVSDSDDGHRKAKRRKSIQVKSMSLQSGARHAQTIGQFKGARRRIAEQIKLKL
ncbi:hypothetical protein IWW57_002654 [Coemansia sp. S610]|nr:hypothetical protein IWW57_002654 [Coemansia sp. S610]